MEVPLPAVEKVVAFFLPFAPQSVLAQLSVFFANAQKIKGLGIRGSYNCYLELSARGRSAQHHLESGPVYARFFVEAPHVHQWSWCTAPYSFRVLRGAAQRKCLMSSWSIFFRLDILFVSAYRSGVYRFLSGLFPTPKSVQEGRDRRVWWAGVLFELERYWSPPTLTLNAQTVTIYGAFGILSVLFLFRCSFASCFICSAPKWPLSPRTSGRCCAPRNGGTAGSAITRPTSASG